VGEWAARLKFLALLLALSFWLSRARARRAAALCASHASHQHHGTEVHRVQAGDARAPDACARRST
jgi:hypothetical protein